MDARSDLPVPVFITVRDRLAPLTQLVGWLESAGGVELTLVDNDSAWPPLLDWLEASPHRVVHTGANLGPRAAWLIGLVQEVGIHRRYVVTDPDVVPDAGCPHDLLDQLSGVLDRHPEVDRVGLGLRIDDLPTGHPHRHDILGWESQFWEDEVEPGLFAADVDTTFALYREGRRRPGRPALRTGPPLVARHLPWYEDPRDDDAERAFYRARADPTVNSWDLEQLPPYLRALIDAGGPADGVGP